mgnify:CR=1 FL=1
MKSAFEKRAKNVAERLAEELDDELQLRAESKGWTTPIHLEAKGAKLNIVYQPQDKSALFLDEYGSENQSPNAVIRPFINAIEPAIAGEIEQEAISYLFENGILP